MLDNHVYNLVHKLAQENKSLWRINKNYKEDADGCEQCLTFWNKLEEDKEARVKELTELVKSHLA